MALNDGEGVCSPECSSQSFHQWSPHFPVAVCFAWRSYSVALWQENTKINMHECNLGARPVPKVLFFGAPKQKGGQVQWLRGNSTLVLLPSFEQVPDCLLYTSDAATRRTV